MHAHCKSAVAIREALDEASEQIISLVEDFALTFSLVVFQLPNRIPLSIKFSIDLFESSEAIWVLEDKLFLSSEVKWRFRQIL